MKQKPPILFGNWKMHHLSCDTTRFIHQYEAAPVANDVLCGIAVPFINLSLAQKCSQSLHIISQNCHFASSGAYTGEISVEMLDDLQIKYIIIGHSERRQLFCESNALVNQKMQKILSFAALTPIFCLGETIDIYRQGDEAKQKYLEQQIVAGFHNVAITNADRVIIAYEPIWAIGTGQVATPAIAEATIAFVRSVVQKLYNNDIAQKISILYGGSVNPHNIRNLQNQPNIDGFLVGGASLAVGSFLEMRRLIS